MKKTIFIFRRDLRVFDNSGLIKAAERGEVLPIFIFDPRQMKNNEYFSQNAFEFLMNSLIELEEEIGKRNGKLNFFYGEAEKVISKIIDQNKIDSIVVNKDVTPFSIERDKKIKEICSKKGVEFLEIDDLFLVEIEKIKKDDGKPYTVYTHFLKKASKIAVGKPREFSGKISNEKISGAIEISSIEYSKNPKIKVRGGRNEGLKLLKKASKIENYEENRNNPSLDLTSHLSAHTKFGVISIREIYQSYALANQDQLIRELYWRDFFSSIAYNFPQVFRGAFREKYNKIEWEKNKEKLNAWKEGKTGYPIVDAGMRELNETGYMHNRVRMICASFLVKDLHINWKEGEKYFAQKLVDYDPSVNNGNWQWSASTGCDAQPYFRIFNPKLQQERFDPHCKYVKTWVLELRDCTIQKIMEIYEGKEVENYPKKIVDHKKEVEITKEMYKRAENSHL